MDKQVNVLISTYNGEKYIEEQLKSIEEQSYRNIKIYVRDDGSTDHTVEILKKWEDQNKIIFSQGPNVGYGKSFLTLLAQSDEGDYWAFCDQDDIWLKDKIKWAVEWLEKQQKNCSIPLMYHGAFAETDENLNITGEYLPPNYKYDFRRSITECVHMGFSTVFNKQLRQEMLKCNIDNLVTHDWWAELIVMEFGQVYFDSRISSWHRRLNDSVSGMNLSSRFKWLWRTLHSESEIVSCTREFKRVFGDQGKKPDMDIINLFVSDHYSIKKSLKKAFYPARWRASITSEAVVRMLMLLGKI